VVVVAACVLAWIVGVVVMRSPVTLSRKHDSSNPSIMGRQRDYKSHWELKDESIRKNRARRGP